MARQSSDIFIGTQCILHTIQLECRQHVTQYTNRMRLETVKIHLNSHHAVCSKSNGRWRWRI